MLKLYIKKSIASVLALLTLATCLSMGSVAFAEDLVAINEQNFPDKTFRDYISEHLDLDGSGGLSDSELKSAKVLMPNAYLGADEKIADLTGIEKFYNLEKIYCDSHELKTLDLSKNLQLNTVSVMGNDLSEIKVGSLPNLVSLNCAYNNITSLDVSGCPQLHTLRAENNAIKSIDLKKNPELTILSIVQNELSELDLSANTKLQEIYCANNHLAELDLSSNTALEKTSSNSIGNQWIELPATVNEGKISIPKTFADSSRIISTSLDTVVQNEDGEERVLAYSNGEFVTDELINISGKLVDPNEEVHDGFVYRYNTGNSNCELMTVNTVVIRNLYQVNFYLDETKSKRLSYVLVKSGGDATAPAVPDAPTCKKFVSWSEDCKNVKSDKDIYIVWADDHNIVGSIDSKTGDIDLKCTKCNKKTLKFNFMDTYNCFKGDKNYNPDADVNNDGVVNAKDFAIIYKDYKQ